MSAALETAYAAEVSVIGAMLIDDRCIPEVLQLVQPEHFQTPRLRAMFAAARSLYAEGLPVDAVTVSDRAGGGPMAQTAAECMDVTPTAANVAEYCRIVREQATLAQMKRTAEALAGARTVDEARDILAGAQGLLADRPGVRTVSLAGMMADFLRRMTEPKPDYLHWGLGILDDMLRTGPGSYVILAARPSTGKTAMAVQLALEICKRKRVGFYSLETVPEILADRIAAAQLGYALPTIKDRKVTPSDLQVMATRMGESEALRGSLDVVSAGSLTVADIRTMALARRHEVVMIDYVQLIRPVNRGERAEQMQSVSMELRAMAQTTGTTVVALAQLRRPDSQGKAKAPTMADLRESGQFEQDADTVLLMYLENAGARNSDRYVKIEKNKEGYAGFRARFSFDGAHQIFTPVDKDGKAIPKAGKIEEVEDDEHLEILL